METTKKKQLTLIKEQMTLIYEGDPWYGGAVKAVLESVNPKYVFDSPGNNMHTIAELVAHMVTWREFAKRRLRGEVEYLPEQEQTFNWEWFSTDKKEVWDILINRLHDSQEQLLSLLHRQDDSILKRKVAGKPYTFHYLLTGIVQHDLYHLGQVVYIQKLLEEKNRDRPAGGLRKYSYRIFSFENLALLK